MPTENGQAINGFTSIGNRANRRARKSDDRKRKRRSLCR